MAIKKEDVLARIAVFQKELSDGFERDIDVRLDLFTIGQTVTAFIPKEMSDGTVADLKTKYEVAGWTVEFMPENAQGDDRRLIFS